MNIVIPHSWLKDYIITDASVNDIAEALSLHSFSVEKIIKQGNDHIFEIEVTSNRGDALSVLGIARELRAVLPKLGFKAQWKDRKITPEPLTQEGDKIDVVIEDKTLVPRFSALVLDNIKIKDSPDLIKKRLEMVGIRPLGNVIDVTNYMMIDKGQPMHAFDYDKIEGSKMIVRESKKDEKLTTLDGVKRSLPEGVIVIEDGSGRLIDLCGIMGAQNSEVDENTNKVLLFVQVYDPQRIRKASMSLGHRTDAALRFEKGIDLEGVIPALWESVSMLKETTGAKVSSNMVDILNVSVETKRIPLDYEKINLIAGTTIEKSEVDRTLISLGFNIEKNVVIVPSWRRDDIEIIEDLAEEVIRVYGYYNLPNLLLTNEIPRRVESPTFYWERVAKDYLKYQGFFECYTPSATSEENVTKGAIRLANPFNEDFMYLRPSLVPQLTEVLRKNKGYSEKIKLFELSEVYIKNGNKIPKQPLMLSIVTIGIKKPELKGIFEGLLKELGVTDFGEVSIRGEKEGALTFEIDFEKLTDKATKTKSYTPLTRFNSIKEDITLDISSDISYKDVEKCIYSSDKRITKVTFKDIYKNYLTLSIEYLDRETQISSVDTQKIRDKIFKGLESKFGIRLKT